MKDLRMGILPKVEDGNLKLPFHSDRCAVKRQLQFTTQLTECCFFMKSWEY